MAKNSNTPLNIQFVSLLTEHQADLWAYIISQLPGSSEVEDVLQKTNLTLWTKQDQFQIGSNFVAWAFTVARFEVLAHLKKHKRQDWLVFNDELSETIAAEAQQCVAGSNKRLILLENCMQKMRPQDVELLRQRYQSRSALSEYAKQCGRSVSALSVTLHRVRAALRKCIEKGELA